MGFDPRIELADYSNRWEYNDVVRRLGDATLAEDLFCLESGLEAVLHAAEAKAARCICMCKRTSSPVLTGDWMVKCKFSALWSTVRLTQMSDVNVLAWDVSSETCQKARSAD